MNQEDKFFIYLLENYSSYKNSNAKDVLNMWDSLNLTDYIRSMYERYHTERLENAFEDIDRMINEKKK